MKKIVSYILIISLLLFAAGCKKTETVLSTTAPTEPTEKDEPIILDAPFIAVGLPVIEDTLTAKDGTTIFTSSQPYMTLTMNGQVTADLIINDFMNRVSTGMSASDDLKNAAIAAYEYNNSNWTPYSLKTEFAPMRIDPNVLSLSGSIVSYSGSSHPEYVCVSANYNLISGDPLTLGSILTHEDAIPLLRDLLIGKLEAQAEEKFLREQFQDDIRMRFADDVSFDEDWYFSDTGLCFYFAPYQIAPYSSGVIIAEIPYSELVGIIEEEFFPAEYSFSNGNANVLPFTTDATSHYDQRSELILDHQGQKFLVEADSCIQNIRIVLRPTTTGESDIILATHYNAYCLNPGNAIMVQIPNSSSAVYCVEYQQNGATVSIPIVAQ